MGRQELFNFMDENIPKIENIKLNEPSAKKSLDDLTIDEIENMQLTNEIIKMLSSRIHENVYSDEEKRRILVALQKQLNNQETPTGPPKQETEDMNKYQQPSQPQPREYSRQSHFSRGMNPSNTSHSSSNPPQQQKSSSYYNNYNSSNSTSSHQYTPSSSTSRPPFGKIFNFLL